MLYWVIQITIISFILIFLVHHIINFFKSVLTVPKIKDLVNVPTQKYENMYNIINSKQPHTEIANTPDNLSNNSPNNSSNEYTLIDLLPNKEETNMKSELKNFLKSQLH
jgi:ABC-type transport system involved in multi-copper enzyme maturation permease subunit